jgi:adenylylsulfate kinase-like enzyme
MILCLYGQPGSGKTTLARAFMEMYDLIIDKRYKHFYHIDGDMLREVTQNNDYTRQGRIENCMLANRIAMYSQVLGYLPVMSIVHPFGNERAHLVRAGACLIYLINANTPTDKRRYRIADFESLPVMNVLYTGACPVDESARAVLDIYNRHANR